MINFKKLLVISISSLMLVSCQNGQTITDSTSTNTSSTSEDTTPEEESKGNMVLGFNFDECSNEKVINEADGKEYKIEYLFNEQNADKIFKAPTGPLFKQGVHGKSLYMDGHSTRMIYRYKDAPRKALSISCWIAPRGFENVFYYSGEGPAAGHRRMTAILNQGNIEAKNGFVFGYGRLGVWGIQMCVRDKDTGEERFLEYVDPLNSLVLYEWNHIAVSYDGETGYIALSYNGKRAYEIYDPALANTEIISSPENFYMGYYCYPMVEFGCNRQLPAGLIDDLYMYDFAQPLGHYRDEYKNACVNGEHPVLPFEEVQIDRSIYEGDRYRPIYHGIPPGVWMNEPHAPIYYKGMYHLFYQHDPIGPYWSQIRWAHLVSPDMIHWKAVKDAVVPTPGICPEGVWTGGSVIGPDGTPWLAITAGLADNETTWSIQNVAYAHCVDPEDPYLTDWVVEDKVVITHPSDDSMGERHQFRDPFVWYDDGLYYMLVSTSVIGGGGSANVFTSKDMRDWTYHGFLFTPDIHDHPIQGEHWECVVMFPISNKSGTIQKWILFDCPQYTYERTVDCLYWIGQFDKHTCKFTAEDDEPKLFDYGDGIYTGQTGFCYRTEEDIANGKTRYEDGRTVLISLAQGKSAGTEHNIWSGWAHSLALPLELHLADDGVTVLREPISELSSAYGDVLFEQQTNNLSVNEMNDFIANVRGDSLEIKAKLKINTSNPEYTCGLNVRYNKNEINGKTERTKININQNGVYVDRLKSTLLDYPIKSDTHTAPTNAKEIDLKIYLDHSSVEIYINDSEQITTRIFPKCSDSDYLCFFDGEKDELGNPIKLADMTISDLKITKFESVYFDHTTPSYYGNSGTLAEVVG